MKRFKKILIPLTVMTMFVSGCSGKDEQASVTEVEEDLTAVEVQQLTTSSIERKIVYVGKVEPNETVNVTSKLSGQVEKIYFDLGDTVKKGDVLFTLKKDDINDQIKQLEASLKISDASVATAETSLQQVNGGQTDASRLQLEKAVETARISVDNAKIALETSQINLDSNKINLENSKISLDNTKASLDDITNTYENMKTLYEAGVISKSEFDSTQLQYTQMKNSYDQAQNTYNQAQNSYDQTSKACSQAQNSYDQAQVSYNQSVEALDIFNNKTLSDSTQAAQKGVESAVASRNSVLTQLEIAKDSLKDTSITAPISGIISNKNINESNMVSAQSAPFTIVDMSRVTVDVNVSEKLINLLSVGQEVEVKIPTINDEKMVGNIKNISPAVDNTNTYPVKIEINNSEGAIKPGMFAEISFIENQNNEALVVPRNTILEDESNSYVYVVKDGVAIKTIVETGIDNGEEIELVSGINMGDEVIVNGQNYVEDGEKVNIVSNEEDTESQSEDASESNQEDNNAEEATQSEETVSKEE